MDGLSHKCGEKFPFTNDFNEKRDKFTTKHIFTVSCYKRKNSTTAELQFGCIVSGKAFV